jgi:uncharacterized membrane protein YeaQ/YmgE (transglycosylase-associated protein family)
MATAQGFEFVGILLIIGCVVGWLAATIVQGTGLGKFADIAIGVVGAFIGGQLVDTEQGLVVDALIGGPIGAVLLLLVARFAAPWIGPLLR